MANKIKETIVTFILDESGSMEPVRTATISGFNEYVSTLKSDDTPTLLRLMTFNSGDMRAVYSFEDVSSVKEMTQDDYKPGHLTPLYDAVARGILDTDGYLEKASGEVNVIFVIMTDGLENDSKEYGRKHVFDMISKRGKQGWTFTYIGANQDAWEVGRGIGIGGGHTVDYDADAPKVALGYIAASNLRAKQSMARGQRSPKQAFTEEERRSMKKPGRTA
jgi:hypothetical protein